MLQSLISLFSLLWQGIASIFEYFWWLIAPMILMPMFVSTWLFYRRDYFKHHLKFVTLELQMPREINRSIKAMDQVFAAMWNLKNAPANFEEFYIDGEITRPYHFELVSFGGDIHFYVRAYHKQRNLVEAAFAAYYTDVELKEVDDYMDRIPASIKEVYDQNYDMYGAEIVMKKDKSDNESAIYPIKSYMEFESPAEEKEYDPMSVFLEVLAKVKKEETLVFQFIVTPSAWSDHQKHELEVLREMKVGAPAPGQEFGRFQFRSPGETAVLEAVERNLSKPAFDCTIRALYLSPQNLFYDSFVRRAVTSTFNQYDDASLNGFRINYKTATLAKVWNYPYIFPNLRNDYRKARLLHNFRHRESPPHEFMGRVITSTFWNWNDESFQVRLSTESLATVFHPPTKYVLTAPHIERVESRKAGPPAGLAIFGEEGDIKRFE